MDQPPAAESSLWRWIIIGAILLWLPAMLGILPLENARQLMIHRTVLTAGEAAAAVLMWRVCRKLLQHQWPWSIRISVLCVVAYLLAYVASGLADFAMGGDIGWHGAIRLGFIGAAMYMFPLLAWTAVYLAKEYWRAALDKERRLLRAETMARDAELRALRSELTPHFLFNTLNAISTLVGEGNSQQARDMIARLGDFLRSTLHEAGHADISLERELERANEYLSIEQIRLGDRLRLNLELDRDVCHVPVPNLILQPLVENAIRHGIAPDPHGGELSIRALNASDRVRISVENTMRVNGTPKEADTPTGLGLNNTRNRLAARDGSAFRFASGADGVNRWRATLEIPNDRVEINS